MNRLLNEEIRKDIKRVFDLQEKRVLISNEFDIKFKEYLLDAPDFKINKLETICKEISDDMNLISNEIIQIKLNFSPQVYNVPKMFTLIHKLQDLEQTKFKNTLDYYINEQQRLEKLSQTDEYEFEFKQKLSQIKKELNGIKLEINECLEEMRYELYETYS